MAAIGVEGKSVIANDSLDTVEVADMTPISGPPK